MYRIQWSGKALKQFSRIGNARDQTRIADAVETLSAWPVQLNVKTLANHQFGYRLRVGSYRVLFDVENEIRIIAIQEVKKRDDRTY